MCTNGNNKRKTSKDYLKELNEILQEKIALENRIRNRFKEMCKQNAGMVIGNTYHIDDYTNDRIEKMDTFSIISVMTAIETELEKQQPFVQTKMF